MNRRTFLSLTATLPAAAFAPLALAAETLKYEPGMIDALLAENRTLVVGFSADWCSTCRAQERVLNRLRGEYPDYDARLTFVRVDWDTHQNGDLVRRHAIPRRSTFLVLHGERELARLVAETGADAFVQMLDIALAAAKGS